MRSLVTLLVAGLVLASCEVPSASRTPGAEASKKTAKSFVAGSRLLRTEKALPGRYIVVLDPKGMAGGRVGLLADQLSALHGASVERVYSHALHGFAARMPEVAALALSNNPSVLYVEEDGEVSLEATQVNPSWGLDRIDQQDLPLNQSYSYDGTGSGVNAYVIDTGIRITHAEFGGRAVHGFSSINDGNGADDCHGHGTHVAGTIGGTTYGVAKGVNLHAVRVLNCVGSGSWSEVIAGVDWVTANHVKPAVANMSLGGGEVQSLDDAVTASINAGVFYGVAAGNNNGDACFLSPAGTPAAMTVGATEITDARASFSNYGTCVDLFAPGQSIISAWNTSDTSTNTISGTSMATPHVVGIAALYLEGRPLAEPAAVTDALLSRATPGKVIDPGAGSPNRLLFAACAGTDQIPPQVVLTAPSAGAALSGTVTLSAAALDEGTGVTKVEFFLGSRSLGSDTTAPYELLWSSETVSNGTWALTAKAYDDGCNQGVSTPVEVTTLNPGSATFHPAWGTPACTSVGGKCDSGELLEGRGSFGPELHQPNTVGGSCTDGTGSMSFYNPSLERLAVARGDGTAFAAGKEVTVEATVHASTSFQQEALDLYVAPDASNPTWTLIGSLAPSQRGAQVLSTKYLLPAGGLQVLRGVYRSGSGASACVPGPLNDHDDLVFAVGEELDSTPPSVAITAPAEGATVEGVVAVAAAASDNFGVQRVELYDGAALVATDDRAPYVLSWASRATPNGSHTLTARAYDVAGNVSSSAPVNVLANNDFVPPQVSLISPLNGSTVLETVTLQATASDDRGVARVEFSVDGTLIGSRSVAPYYWNWGSRTVPNGLHVLSAVAYDAVGNASSQSSVSVLVDNDLLPPETAITAPAPGAIVSGRVSLEASASDNRKVNQVHFFVGSVLIGSDSTAPYSVVWDSAAMINGSYTLTSKAYDSAGYSTTSAPITVETNNTSQAHYDPILKAPRCDAVTDRCDTWNLVRGRAQFGPELNMPNTLDGCLDGTQQWYSSSARHSLERIRVIREDGTALINGKKVRIVVEVGTTSSSYVDLYFAADATQPVWTYLTTVMVYSSSYPVSAEYILPLGSLQAVRATLRRGSSGDASPCSAGQYDERDDLVFAVAADTVAPTAAITAPASGATVSGTVTVTASASDDVGVVAVEFYDGETLIGTDVSAPYSVSWATRTGPNGSHTLTARAYDPTGLVGTSQPVTVTVDNDWTAPVVSITAPAEGATVVGTVVISTNATDNLGVTRVEFYAGARLLGSSNLSSPYTYSWDTRPEPTGEHVLTAKAYDAAGNVASSSPVRVSVTRDTTPPSVTITSPASGATLVGTVWFTADVTDDVGVSKTELLLDGTLLKTDVSLSPYYLWNTKTAANGSHTLTARVTDTYGNVNSSSVSVTVDNDFTPPSASLTSPASGATVSGTVALQASATDNKSVSRVRFFVNGTLVGTDLSVPYSLNWNSKTFSNGTFTLTVQAEDPSGNVGTSSPLTVVVDNDYTPPTVAITSPASGAIVEGVVPIRAEATDNKGITQVAFYLNGQLAGTDTTAPYSLDWDTGAGVNGSYAWRAVASDAANNASASADVWLTVNQLGAAVFDPGLHAPKCSTPRNSCDTTVIVKGRSGGESNAPNTLGTCADGYYYDLESYPKINRIKVSRINGEHLAEGRLARIDVHVRVYQPSSEFLDLFYASDATQPTWTYLTTLQPASSASTLQMLSATYLLPAGGLQAVRAQYRMSGTPGTTCSTGWLDDRDDVVFAVGPPTDALPPTAALTAPSSNAWVSGAVTVSATAEDDLAVARVEFYADGALIGTDTSAPYAVSWNSTTVAGGPHTLVAKAYDAGGRVGSSSGLVVHTDTTPPDTALTSPGPGALVRSVAVLKATASDNWEVAKVEFYVGTTLWAAVTTPPYETSWNTLSTAQGAVTLTVKAYDSVGNVRTSTGVGVTVDNASPTTALSAPAQNALVGGTVQLSATASDNVAVSTVEFYVGGTLVGTDTSAPYGVSWDSTTVANGSITLATRAYDTAGNVALSANSTVTVDNVAPTVALTSPANGSSAFLSTTVQASAGDNVGVARVVFYDGGAVIGTDTTAPYSVGWNLLSVPKGWHTVTARAYDWAGNVTTSAAIAVKVN